MFLYLEFKLSELRIFVNLEVVLRDNLMVILDKIVIKIIKLNFGVIFVI